MIHGTQVLYTPVSQYNGKPDDPERIEAGMFLEYGDTDANYCRILNENSKIVIVHKQYIHKVHNDEPEDRISEYMIKSFVSWMEGLNK